MDLSGWNHLNHHVEAGPFIAASDISGPDRLLLAGYDVDRNDFEVTLFGSEITIQCGNSWEIAPSWPVWRLYPNKRVYADQTDLSFAILLKKMGASPTYINIPTESEPA